MRTAIALLTVVLLLALAGVPELAAKRTPRAGASTVCTGDVCGFALDNWIGIDPPGSCSVAAIAPFADQLCKSLDNNHNAFYDTPFCDSTAECEDNEDTCRADSGAVNQVNGDEDFCWIKVDCVCRCIFWSATLD